MTLEEIKSVLALNKEDLRHRYKVKELGVFGSYAKDEQGTGSDLDILVDFEEPVGFFTFLELEAHLEVLTQLKVDLVTRKALKPHIGAAILKEVVYL